MKKILGLFIAFIFVIGLTACDQGGYLGEDDPNSTTTTAVAATTDDQTTDDQTTVAPTTEAPTTEAPTTAATNTDVDDILAILNANGYTTITIHNSDAIEYFTNNTLIANYGLSVTCTDLIMADINGNEWLQVMGFATEADAITYANYIDTLDDGRLIYRNGTAVLYTYSQTALDFFN